MLLVPVSFLWLNHTPLCGTDHSSADGTFGWLPPLSVVNSAEHWCINICFDTSFQVFWVRTLEVELLGHVVTAFSSGGISFVHSV